MEKLKEKYGLLTAISVVFGIVVGSGIFFKADDVLKITGGSIVKSIIAWTLGAVAMIFGALVFGEYAQRIQKTNGLVDYFEDAYGELPAYLVGWFKWLAYLSPLTAIVGWVSALYTLVLFGKPTDTSLIWILSLVYIVIFYLINYYAPILGGKFQVSTTFIKLVPILFVGIAGLIYGLSSGVLSDSISAATPLPLDENTTFFSAVVATAFAYEGWICATSINSEIKDSKKNLPKALIYGTLAVFVAYVLYFIGIASVIPAEEIVAQGDASVSTAMTELIGNTGSTILTAFVVISCLGTFNGLVMTGMRDPYSMAIRGRGLAPKLISKVDEKTGMPTYSVLASAAATLVYLLLWYFSLNDTFGVFIAIDEIPIVSIYVVYILLYVAYIRDFKDLSFIKRYVVPILAIAGAGVILYGGIMKPSIGMYLLISLLLTVLGGLFYKKKEL